MPVNAAHDPNQNHVTFHLRKGGEEQTLSGVGPTQAVDCVAAVWSQLAEGSQVRAADVWQIYSEWEPADEDLEFLDTTFPTEAELAFTFKRPKKGGWKAALAAAAKVIASTSPTKA